MTGGTKNTRNGWIVIISFIPVMAFAGGLTQYTYEQTGSQMSFLISPIIGIAFALILILSRDRLGI